MKKIKVIIIGLGNIGFLYDLPLEEKYVFTHARAFYSHPNFELVAGVDNDINRCKAFTETYSRPSYINIEEALIKHNAELIIISTPTKFHCNVLKTVLDVSLPHSILCEKPLGANLNEAMKMVQLCEKAGCNLFVNYMRRSEEGTINIKNKILSEEIQPPFKGVAWYSKGLSHNGSHFINLLSYWLGKIIDIQIISIERFWNNQDPEPNIKMTFEQGEIFFLSSKEESFSHYSVELIAENGRLNYDQGGHVISWFQKVPNKLISGYYTLVEKPEIISNRMYCSQLQVVEELSKFFLDLPFELCSGKEALITREVLHETLVTLSKKIVA